MPACCKKRTQRSRILIFRGIGLRLCTAKYRNIHFPYSLSPREMDGRRGWWDFKNKNGSP